MATPTQTMRVRSKSPAGRNKIRLNDVSSARSAGTNDAQKQQRIYLNKFVKKLGKEYPENTQFEAAQTKLASFVIPVIASPSVDMLAMAQKIKRDFPCATCVPGTLPGRVLWELPYVRAKAPMKWGDVVFWSMVMVALIVLVYQSLL